jgi:hypothetical protein
MSKERYLRLDNLECDVPACRDQQKGFSMLPIPEAPPEEWPEVFCGNCGSRVEAQFMVALGQ